MSNENRLEAQTSSLGIYDTAKKIPRQGGKIQRLVLTGPDVSLPHQSAYPPVRLERQTALQENPLDRILDKITARFRLGLTATFGLGAAVLPQASTFAQVEQQQDDNNEDSAEVEGVENETNTVVAKTIEPINGRALEARAEILEFPQNFDLDLISRRNRQYPVGLTGGRFFTETAGFPLGFAITNDERFQVWHAVYLLQT